METEFVLVVSVGFVLPVPMRAALTLATVVLSAPKEERSVRIDAICVLERPEDWVGVVIGGVAGAVGAPEVAVAVGVAAVVVIAARVSGPKYPLAGVMLFAFWNLMSAASVAGPNAVVSLPGEPGPVDETVKPWALRNCWSALTSGSVWWSVRL